MSDHPERPPRRRVAIVIKQTGSAWDDVAKAKLSELGRIQSERLDKLDPARAAARRVRQLAVDFGAKLATTDDFLREALRKSVDSRGDLQQFRALFEQRLSTHYAAEVSDMNRDTVLSSFLGHWRP